jgi:hypothetical protein
MGFGAYVTSGAYTSLIPSGFGTLIFLSGLISVFAPEIRKHLMHVAALVGLLGTLGGLGMGLPKLGALLSGTATCLWHADRHGRRLPHFSRAVREVVYRCTQENQKSSAHDKVLRVLG